MIHTPGLLTTILAFIAVVGPLVFVHEFGHYIVARWCGVKAETFSIGFGRELVGWTDRRGTRWKLAWLPLGGYVKFAGDMNPASVADPAWLALPAAERARTFQAKSVAQRAAIVAAGPLTNFLLAIMILTGFAIAFGIDATPAVVGQVVPNSAAAASGVRAGDRIVALADRPMATFKDVAQFAQLRPGETVAARIERGGATLTMPLRIGMTRERDRFGNEYRIGRLGIAASAPVLAKVGPVRAVGEALRMTGGIIVQQLDGLGQIITGRRSVDDLRGPVGMAKVSGEVVSLGPIVYISFIALISINLGFINLLPVPVLDGGHLLFYAIEAVRRRPLEPAMQEWAFRGGMAALLALILVVTFNDLGSLGLWKSLAGLIG